MMTPVYDVVNGQMMQGLVAIWHACLVLIMELTHYATYMNMSRFAE